MKNSQRRARHLASVSHDDLGKHATVVTLKGTFDLANAEGLGNSMTSALDRGPGPVVLDLSEVDWLDSAAIAVLVLVARRGLALDRTIGLVRPKDAIWEGIEALSLDSLFLVFQTRDEAAHHPAVAS